MSTVGPIDLVVKVFWLCANFLRYSELTLHMEVSELLGKIGYEDEQGQLNVLDPLPSEIDIVNNAEQVALFEDIGLGMKHNHSSPSFAFGKFNINECKSA